jgi:hypothetical protein
MGFEPHSVAGSAPEACLPAPTEGASPLVSPHEGSILPSKPSVVDSNLLNVELEFWSGRWDLNPRQLAWEARTLPLSYARPLRRRN